MNTVNASTGFSPFQLKSGRSPRLIPPLVPLPDDAAPEAFSAHDLLGSIEQDVKEAQDNLLRAKTEQAFQANKSRAPEHSFKVGDCVRLSTTNHRKQYKNKNDFRCVKFMPRFDIYRIVEANPSVSTYTLDVSANYGMHPVFHSSELLPVTENDASLYLGRERNAPAPVIIDGYEEFFVEKILEQKVRGAGFQYLVR